MTFTKDIEWDYVGCPCLYVEPCKPSCTCANPVMSGGCDRCCSYGSEEQKTRAAKRIARAVDRDKEFLE